jgi:hypothetical protein
MLYYNAVTGACPVFICRPVENDSHLQVCESAWVGEPNRFSPVKFYLRFNARFPQIGLMCCTLVTLLIFLLTSERGPYRICADDSVV